MRSSNRCLGRGSCTLQWEGQLHGLALFIQCIVLYCRAAADAWALQRELSVLYARFYGALVGGLLLIYHGQKYASLVQIARVTWGQDGTPGEAWLCSLAVPWVQNACWAGSDSRAALLLRA